MMLHKQKEGLWGRKEGWGGAGILSYLLMCSYWGKKNQEIPWSSENQTIPGFQLDTTEAKCHTPLQVSVGPQDFTSLTSLSGAEDVVMGTVPFPGLGQQLKEKDADSPWFVRLKQTCLDLTLFCISSLNLGAWHELLEMPGHSGMR